MNTETGEIKSFDKSIFDGLDKNVWMPLNLGDKFEIGKGKFEVIGVVTSPHNLVILKAIGNKA